VSWAAVIGAGASLLGGAMSANAAEDGADAQSAANAQAIAEQRRQFDLTREDLAPWMQAGGWALDQQQAFLQGDYGNALDSPFYRAAYDQSMGALTSGHAAGGNLWGGGADADRMMLGNQLASQGLLTHYNALSGLSNTGQATASQLGQFGANSANQISGLYNANGLAQASAYAGQANAWGNAMDQSAGWIAYGQRQRNGGGG
jgi:hypothetical protein